MDTTWAYFATKVFHSVGDVFWKKIIPGFNRHIFWWCMVNLYIYPDEWCNPTWTLKISSMLKLKQKVNQPKQKKTERQKIIWTIQPPWLCCSMFNLPGVKNSTSTSEAWTERDLGTNLEIMGIIRVNLTVYLYIIAFLLSKIWFKV